MNMEQKVITFGVLSFPVKVAVVISYVLGSIYAVFFFAGVIMASLGYV
jgi:hypothetical protein